MKRIDELVNTRNAIQFRAEDMDDDVASACWSELGVANRHIERLLSGQLPFSPAVADEIQRSFDRASIVINNARKDVQSK